LQPALFVARDLVGHQRLQRRVGDAAEQAGQVRRQIAEAGGRQSHGREAHGLRGQATDDRATLADPPGDAARQPGLNGDIAQRQGAAEQAEHQRAPAIAEGGVEHLDALVGVEGVAQQKLDQAEPDQARAAQKEAERAPRMGLRPAQRRPCLGADRFRQDEEAVDAGRQGEDRRRPKRRPQVAGAGQQAAKDRAQDDRRPDGRVDASIGARAVLRRGDVGDIGHRRGHAAAGEAAEDARGEQPPDAGRQRAHDRLGADAEHRGDDHRPAAKAVGEHAQHRRREKLRHNPGHFQPADPARRRRPVAVQQQLGQARQNGEGDGLRQDVETDGDGDEDQAGAAVCAGFEEGHEGSLDLGPKADIATGPARRTCARR
jgi:hypothetical protein